jgi:hypothetical protein
MASANLLYDPTIRDALKRKDISLKELKELRSRARAFIKETGNVAAALVELDEEIERRSGS